MERRIVGDRIEINVRVSIFLKKQGKVWTATAPRFGVASQGRNQENAKACVKEALELWVESCVERGTLDEALREIGFRPAAWGSTSEATDRVQVRIERATRKSAIGVESEVEITIPAYQVAAIQSFDRPIERA